MKMNVYLLVLCVMLCVSTSCENSSQGNDAMKHLAISNKIDSLINSYNLSQQFSGSVLVADDGKILINKAYGYLNLDAVKELDEQSVFEIASLSKQFTAMLIMMLREENKLAYDDKIEKHLPNIGYGDVTIRHLLTHTSGFSERQFFRWAGQNMDPSRIYTNEIILTYLDKEKPQLVFEPGSKWEYSNVGYFMLALIIERISGQDYVQFLNDRILEPLEMNNSGIFSQQHKGEQMENYAFGKVYNPKDSAFISSFGMAWSDSLYGGVGILSNTSDLFKWDQALYSERLLPQELLLDAFESHKFSKDSSSNYGFGWFVKEGHMINGINCGKRLDHYGLWPGYESSIVRYTDYKKTIIVLSNQSPSVKDDLVDEISGIIFSNK